jgi:hypothetical protein
VSAKRIFKSAERSYRLQNKVGDYMHSSNNQAVSNESGFTQAAGSAEAGSHLQGESSAGNMSGQLSVNLGQRFWQENWSPNIAKKNKAQRESNFKMQPSVFPESIDTVRREVS